MTINQSWNDRVLSKKKPSSLSFSELIFIFEDMNIQKIYHQSKIMVTFFGKEKTSKTHVRNSQMTKICTDDILSCINQ